MNLNLRYYQSEAVEAAWNKVHSGQAALIQIGCGGGKSLAQAALVLKILAEYPREKILMVVHSKELVENNYNELRPLLKQVSVSIYCAGLGQKIISQVTVAGIKSIKDVEYFHKNFGVVIVDECYSDDTEILTENGFVLMRELGEDRVAQYCQYTGVLDFVRPLRKIEKDYEGEMVRFYTQNALDILVTPGHNMLIRNERTKEWRKIEARNVRSNSNYFIPMAGTSAAPNVALTPLEKFAIMFQADGKAHRYNLNGSFIAHFRFNKERKIEQFYKLMEEGGFKFRLLKVYSFPGNKKDQLELMVYLPCHHYKVWENYFKLDTISRAKAAEIVEYMVHWDGHIASKNCYLYSNTNKSWADFYQAVAILAGYKTYMSIAVDNRSEAYNDVYRLFINKSIDRVPLQCLKTQRLSYEGKVYCVTVPSGNIVVRRNNKVAICGNCDLIPTKDTTIYRSFINECMKHNAEIALIGLTATPFRLDSGLIYGKGELFPDICYSKPLIELIKEGYLCPLTAKEREVMDTSGLHLRGKDYIGSELSERMSAMENITRHALDIVKNSRSRNRVLIFCVSTEHCIALTEAIQTLGEKAEYILSDTKKVSSKQRDERFFNFKQGKIKYLLNVEIATVGVNIPEIDHIVLMRLSKSKRLILQMLGRGTRKHPSKENCLISDYAGVFREHGRIDDMEQYNYATKKAEGGGQAPIRVCIACEGVCAASASECEHCGHIFPKPDPENHVQAFRGAISSLDTESYALMHVQEVRYFGHVGKSGTPVLKVIYYEKGLLGKNIVEWVCFEHKFGEGVQKGRDWWARRSNDPMPKTVDQVLDIASLLPIPVSVQYKKECKYETVIDYIFEEELKNAE